MYAASSLDTGLVTDAIVHTVTLRRKNKFFYARISVSRTALFTLLYHTRALQLTVAFGAVLLTAFSVAFQTTSSTGAALSASISITDDCFAVSSCTGEVTFCGGTTSHLTIST